MRVARRDKINPIILPSRPINQRPIIRPHPTQRKRRGPGACVLAAAEGPADHVRPQAKLLDPFDKGAQGGHVRCAAGGGEGGQDDKTILRPVGAGGTQAPGATPVYLQELIERLNRLFGEAAPLKDQAQFVNHVASIAS